MRIKRKMLEGTLALVRASEQETEPYLCTVHGRQFWVLPGVFSPKYFEDTEFFARELKVHPGEKLLEIGPGTGAVAIIKALERARVTVVELNLQAICNVTKNAIRYCLEQEKLKKYAGSLYEPLGRFDRFDSIFWNVPFAWVPEDAELTMHERAVCDPGYKGIERFIAKAHFHLKPGGRLMIGFSHSLGHVGLLHSLLRKYGYRFTIVARTHAMETNPVTFELYEARLKCNE